MARVNVYIRKEQEAQWEEIKDKSQFVSDALLLADQYKDRKLPITGFWPKKNKTPNVMELQPDAAEPDYGDLGKTTYKDPKPTKAKDDLKVIKTPKEAKEKVPALTSGVCPHGYAIGMCKKSDCNLKYAKAKK